MNRRQILQSLALPVCAGATRPVKPPLFIPDYIIANYGVQVPSGFVRDNLRSGWLEKA
jgi:hypothetical protein